MDATKYKNFTFAASVVFGDLITPNKISKSFRDTIKTTLRSLAYNKSRISYIYVYILIRVSGVSIFYAVSFNIMARAHALGYYIYVIRNINAIGTLIL